MNEKKIVDIALSYYRRNVVECYLSDPPARYESIIGWALSPNVAGVAETCFHSCRWTVIDG